MITINKNPSIYLRLIGLSHVVTGSDSLCANVFICVCQVKPGASIDYLFVLGLHSKHKSFFSICFHITLTTIIWSHLINSFHVVLCDYCCTKLPSMCWAELLVVMCVCWRFIVLMGRHEASLCYLTTRVLCFSLLNGFWALPLWNGFNFITERTMSVFAFLMI